MDSWHKILLNSQASILEALKQINAGSAQIALVVDEYCQLLGTVTDGDIRRGILEGYTLEDSVFHVMNPHPIKLLQGEADKEKLIKIMVENQVHQLPLVNKQNEVVGLETLDELLKPKVKDNLVVIMSGGMGKRLLPLTNDKPKPMLAVGGKPLLEVSIEKLKQQGFRRFCLTIGYKAEIIKTYFENGQKWDISIEYIHEEEPLGTAGALRFLDKKETLPIIVMNGDLLTSIKFTPLLDFHHNHNADCTVCIKQHEYQVPYGVVDVTNQNIINIKEKPVYKYFVNAGMYVINPEFVSHIPQNTYYQMTCFLEKIMQLGGKMKAFPLMEYWSDIGQLSDYEKACKEFHESMS